MQVNMRLWSFLYQKIYSSAMTSVCISEQMCAFFRLVSQSEQQFEAFFKKKNENFRIEKKAY